jgi:hypothetical protein
MKILRIEKKWIIDWQYEKQLRFVSEVSDKREGKQSGEKRGSSIY